MVCIRSSTGRIAVYSHGRCAAAMPIGTPISMHRPVAKITSASVSTVSAQ